MKDRCIIPHLKDKWMVIFTIFLLFTTLSISVFAAETPADKEFDIIAPETVEENEEFTVTVNDKSTGNPVYEAQVDVEWDEYIYYTNNNGEVKLIAPEVDGETIYFIINANC